MISPASWSTAWSFVGDSHAATLSLPATVAKKFRLLGTEGDTHTQMLLGMGIYDQASS